MTNHARLVTVPLLAILLLASGCGGDDPGVDGPVTSEAGVASIDSEAPTPEELEACLATNGFQPTIDPGDPVYGVAEMQVVIEVPGFAAPGGGSLHVFATVEDAEATFVDIADVAFAPVERHRNTVLTELGTGALNEEGAEEVRARMEACIGPADEVGGPEA